VVAWEIGVEKRVTEDLEDRRSRQRGVISYWEEEIKIPKIREMPGQYITKV